MAAWLGNRLLQTLQQLALPGTFSAAEPVELPVGRVLQSRGQPISHVYFPVEAVASVLAVMRNGESIEVAMVGAEGMVGVEICPAQEPAVHDVVVQLPGSALRLPCQALRRACDQAPALYAAALHCTVALMAQTTQTAVCNRLHSTEQQVCRWLLMAGERRRCDELPITQARLAAVLGVRRERVTESAGRLQDAGLIECRRGCIRLANRAGLVARACECYATLQGALASQARALSLLGSMQG